MNFQQFKNLITASTFARVAVFCDVRDLSEASNAAKSTKVKSDTRERMNEQFLNIFSPLLHILDDSMRNKIIFHSMRDASILKLSGLLAELDLSIVFQFLSTFFQLRVELQMLDG